MMVNSLRTMINTGERIARLATLVSGALLFATSGLIAVEVILRKAFTISLGGADELSGYAMAISCSWAFAYALYRKAHIRIDVVYSRLAARLRLALDILSLSLFALFMTVLSYFAGQVVLTSIARQSTANTSLQTPMWIPQSLWLIGLLFFTWTIYMLLFGTIGGIWQRGLAKVQQISAIGTLDEEIEEGNAAAGQETATCKGGGR